MFRMILIAFAMLLAASAQATTVTQKSFSAAAANANHLSNDSTDTATAGGPMDLSSSTTASFQCWWSGLTGTLNATITVEVTNDPAFGHWDQKANANVTLSSASGLWTQTLSGIVAERWYRLNYAKGSVTAGSITCYAIGK